MTRIVGSHHDSYLKTDVLLLVDAFETFWNMCLEHNKVDPAQFHTASG